MPFEIKHTPRRAGKTEAAAAWVAHHLCVYGQWPHIATGDGGAEEVARIRERAYELYTQMGQYLPLPHVDPWKDPTMPIAPEDRIFDEDLPGFWDRTPAEHYIEAERLLADADRESAASANAQMRVAKAHVHAVLATYIHEPIEVHEEPMRFDPPRRLTEDVHLPAEPDEVSMRRSLRGQPDGV